MGEKEKKDLEEKENLKETIKKLQKYYDNPLEAVLNNCLNMKVNNTPILNAPNRGEMPQTSKDPDLFKDLKSGISKI